MARPSCNLQERGKLWFEGNGLQMAGLHTPCESQSQGPAAGRHELCHKTRGGLFGHKNQNFGSARNQFH